MGTREMPHPLCCISLDLAGLGARSPSPDDPPPRAGEGEVGPADPVTFCGALYKWTNIRKGWRLRWFSLHDGVLSYSKIARRDLPTVPSGSRVRLIGNSSSMFSSSYSRGGCGCRQPRLPVRLVQLKISSFRESKTDDRRFYIFSPKKTLHLKTDSSQDRVAWIEALISASKEFSTSKQLFFMPTDVPFSTEKLKDRMRAEGLDEAFIEDCEKIIHSEFSEYLRHFKLQFEDHLNTITFHQQLEEVDVEDMTNDSEVQLTNADFSSYRHEKSIESSTTVSSDDIEKQELDELSDEDEVFFFDANECLDDPTTNCVCKVTASDESGRISESENNSVATVMVRRREKLPEPVEMEKCASLWSMIKNNVGKDLSKVCLPVYFNEPLSSLQKCFEDLEYSYLLDQAYEYGKKGDSLMRILNVAAFAASGYSSCDGRVCKPFNPLLGETYEAEFPEKEYASFLKRQRLEILGDSNLKSKFWGQSIQLDPVGILTLEFDDGETFQWSKVTTTIYNLIVGKVYCNHHGTMNIRGNKEFSCTLKFREQTLLDRNPRQVQGFIVDTKGSKIASLLGKWDDSMYYSLDNAVWKSKTSNLSDNATLLWKRNKLPDDPTRYNLTAFAITLNELTPGLKEKLPPTDSRLRPDQRYLENGEYEKANAEKLRLEQRQRQSKKLQENGWKPRWFLRDCENGTFCYTGGYWEAREQKKWDDCVDIFGKLSTTTNSESCCY